MKRKIISLILALIFTLTPIVPYDAEDEQVLYATNIAPNTRASVLEDATIFRGDYKLTDSDYIATGDIINKDGIEYSAVVLGDVNGDGLINSTDFMRVRRAYLSLYTFEGANYKAADVNCDGIINSTDFMRIRRHYLSLFTITPQGDGNIIFDTPPADENKPTINGFIWQLDGATFENGTIICSNTASAKCQSVPDYFVFEADVSSTIDENCGIMINSTLDESYYIIKINPDTDLITAVKHTGTEKVTVGSAHLDTDDGDFVRVKLGCFGSSMSVTAYKSGKTPINYPIFDFFTYDPASSSLSIVSGSGEIKVKDISLTSEANPNLSGKYYKNSVQMGADPAILCYDGTYYLYSTNDVNNGYLVYTSKNLSNWLYKGRCLYKDDVYCGDGVSSSAGFWAPEVYEYNGKFYMIYTVNLRLGIAVADSPLGPFKSPVNRYISNNEEIDGHLFFDDNGKTYIYTSRYGQIWGAEFDMETYTYKNARMLLSATDPWEMRQGALTEGPIMTKHNGKYYLTYSANDYQSQDYAIGLAVSDNPLSGFIKYGSNPILQKNEEKNVYGPGHHNFFYSADGQEMFIVYHKHNSATSIHERRICIDRCYFEYDVTLGMDVLKIAGPSCSPQPTPKIVN